MSTSSLYTTFLALAATLLATTAGGSAKAVEEFRIETHVFVGDGAEPVAQTVTLFERGAVYDFSESPPQVVVYRRGSQDRAGEFYLLDPQRRQRTQVTTDRIDALMRKVAQWSAEQEDAVLQFSAQPQFETDYNKETGALVLASNIWTYRVATAPADSQAAMARYRDFTDWYARLNSMLHGSPPPGPRLVLNEALEKHGVIPVEINRTIAGDDAPVRAAHLFSWRLSREDRARLDETQKQLASFEKVDNETYMAK